jgi:hypothetical protein
MYAIHILPYWIKKRLRSGGNRGQSLVELSLIVPLLLLMLVGMIEVGFVIFNYLNALDLTREAARFASTRDFSIASPGSTTMDDCTDGELDFFKDTACFFVDPSLNPNLPLDAARFDDATISVFTVVSGTVATISDRWPKPPIDTNTDGVWSLYSDNWTKDCQGNTVLTEPFFTDDEVEALFLSTAPKAKGLVLVEVYICYDQIIHMPFISDYIGSPFRIHTYSFMPAPEAIPTPTPIP